MTTKDEATAAVESLRAVGLTEVADWLAGELAGADDCEPVIRSVCEAARMARDFADVLGRFPDLAYHAITHAKRLGTMAHGLSFPDLRPLYAELLADLRERMADLQDPDPKRRLATLADLWRRHTERGERFNPQFSEESLFRRDEADALRDLIGLADDVRCGDALAAFVLRVILERLAEGRGGDPRLLSDLLNAADDFGFDLPRRAAREVALAVAERRGVRLDPKRRRWLVERGGRR